MWTKTKILKQLEHLPEEFSIDQLIEQLLNSEDDFTQGRVQSLKDLNKASEKW